MEIRALAPVVGPQGLDALGATAAPAPEPAETPTSKALDPPVRLDIGGTDRQTRFVRDADTSTMVFQVVDPGSGDVLAQLPSETALRNRAYATAHATAGAPALSRVA